MAPTPCAITSCATCRSPQTGIFPVRPSSVTITRSWPTSWEICGALNIIWSFVRRTNQYIERSEPWRIARQPEQQDRLDTVLYTAAEATRLLAIFLAPYIPSASNNILGPLGLESVDNTSWLRQGTWGNRPFTRVNPGPLLFPRMEE